VDFFDADGLSGEDGAEVDFFLAETDAATTPGTPLISASMPAL
jgi:hypothetical protein